MGMLVNGTWLDDDPLPADGTGRFVRPDSVFRDWVTRDGSSGFKAEAGRYQLVTAPSCPWAHRTVLMRKLKGLDGARSLSSNPTCRRARAGPIRTALTISRQRAAPFTYTRSTAPHDPIIPAAPPSRCCGT